MPNLASLKFLFRFLKFSKFQIKNYEVSAKIPKNVKGNFIECELCTKVVSNLEGKLDESETRDKIIELLKDECSKILQPNYAEECSKFVDSNIDKIIGKLKEEINNNEVLSPDKICEKFGACISKFLVIFIF